MTPAEFKRSLSKPAPPARCSPALQALWWAAKDDWNAAHEIVMKHDDADCAWLHAHLHRAEGGVECTLLVRPSRQARCRRRLEAERDAIVAALL
jgi:hypothetical protein